ncbi:MAG: peptidoglycan DD-metalloendopeptidase family protein [Pseudomonadota bacterium]
MKRSVAARYANSPPRPSVARLVLAGAAATALLLVFTLLGERRAPPPEIAAPEPARADDKAGEEALVTRPLALPGQERIAETTTPATDSPPTLPPEHLAAEHLRQQPPEPEVESIAAGPTTETTPIAATVTAQADTGPAVADEGVDSGELTLTVQRGDSLDRLFRRHGLSVADLHAMLQLAPASKALRMVRPGDEITIRRDGAAVLGLTRRLDDFRLLEIDRVGEAFDAEVALDAPERRVTHAYGTITSSLFNAGKAAGISDTLVMELAGVFAWDIDFVLDIRDGDEFVVLYEELWRDGEKLRDGAILAAEFTNMGTRHRALRYAPPEDGKADYFTPDGLSMRKAFLRAPVDFSRISGNFNPRRRHPILNTIRAHRGVDYAAPAGTPIKAAGDGKVSFRGVKGGYGNTIILQHGDNITTLYAHLSRFGTRKRGARVRQGDVIGYVGKTGLATGNHLHYEYRIAGVHRNPRTVPLPQAEPVPQQLRPDFDAHAAHLLAQLELVRSVRLAAVTERPEVEGAPPGSK